MLVREMASEIRLLAKRGKLLAKRGKGLRAIAREVGVSRNTVRRYLRDGDAERCRPRPRRSGKLAAFDEYIAYPHCYRDDYHDACVLYNPVSHHVPYSFFRWFRRNLFFVFSMGCSADLSSPLAGYVTCNTRLKISAVWWGPTPFNL